MTGQYCTAVVKLHVLLFSYHNFRLAACRTKLSMYHDDLEKERDQNTALVNTLQGEHHRLQVEVQQRDTMLKAEKQKALHAQLVYMSVIYSGCLIKKEAQL